MQSLNFDIKNKKITILKILKFLIFLLFLLNFENLIFILL